MPETLPNLAPLPSDVRKSARRRLLLLGALTALGSCTHEPQEAIIVLHGTQSDSVYLDAIAGPMAEASPPIRIHVVQPTGQALDPSDKELQAAEAVAALENLVGVVGHRDSRSTLVVGPVYRDRGVPLVVPNSTSGAIASLGPDVFRLVPDDAAQGAFLADAAVERLGALSITLFFLADEYGTGIRDGVMRALPPSVDVLDQVEYGLHRHRCPDDFQPFVDAALLKGAPDVAILGSRSPDAGCIARLVSQRAPGTSFLAADGVERIPEFLDAAEPALDRLWFVRFWTADGNPRLQEFRTAFEAVTGTTMDAGTPLRMDGVFLLADAVRAEGPTPEDVIRYLESLGRSRPPYRGLTGPISFDGQSPRLYLVDARGRLAPWLQ